MTPPLLGLDNDTKSMDRGNYSSAAVLLVALATTIGTGLLADALAGGGRVSVRPQRRIQTLSSQTVVQILSKAARQFQVAPVLAAILIDPTHVDSLVPLCRTACPLQQAWQSPIAPLLGDLPPP